MRHIRDINNQKKSGLRWKVKESERAIKFICQYCTVEVKNEIQNFNLHPFQRFIVGAIFGWFNADGTRRFRNAYIEQGKGSGKTPLAAAIGLYGLIADGQISPEIYFAAVTREQANIGWRDAKAMAERSPALNEILHVAASSIQFPEKNGIFRALSSEHRGLDGKRPHIALVDELHEHPTGMVVDKMRAGTKARRNALIFRITNSGADLESVCWYEHEYSLKVLDGSVDDPAWFAYVCALDEDDDWTDEKCWLKTNPGLGPILPVEYLREQVREAQGMPSKQNIVKRLNFCIWTQQHEVWIPIEDWSACDEPIDYNALIGEPCWVGIDLSDKIDLSVLTLIFRWQVDKGLQLELPTSRDEKTSEPHKETVNIDFGITIVPYFFIPEQIMYEREREDRVPYTQWAKDGAIYPTPGAIVDYDFIYDMFIKEIALKYSVQQVRYDPRGATQLARKIGEAGFEAVEIGQGFNHLSEPSQIFEALILARRVKHGNHPVMRWNVQNVAVAFGKYNDIRPFKSHRKKRIDGVIGAVMGIGGAMLESGMSGSVYDTPEEVWVNI
jgi:phage terminase large subunit-like protein